MCLYSLSYNYGVFINHLFAMLYAMGGALNAIQALYQLADDAVIVGQVAEQQLQLPCTMNDTLGYASLLTYIGGLVVVNVNHHHQWSDVEPMFPTSLH